MSNQLPSVITSVSYQRKLDVTISPASGEFIDDIPVTVAADRTGTTIYYTTDGSTPSSTSGTLYTGGFTVSMGAGSPVAVKAIAYHDNCVTSDVSTNNYTFDTTVITELKVIKEGEVGVGITGYVTSIQFYDDGAWTTYMGPDNWTITNGSWNGTRYSWTCDGDLELTPAFDVVAFRPSKLRVSFFYVGNDDDDISDIVLSPRLADGDDLWSGDSVDITWP